MYSKLFYSQYFGMCLSDIQRPFKKKKSLHFYNEDSLSKEKKKAHIEGNNK